MKKYLYCITLLVMSICDATQPISLDNIYMNVVKTDACGVVNAEYSGGKIQQGFLVGRFDEENHLLFSYCQLQVDGRLDNGASECEVSKDQNGKILLTEHFEWASRPGEMGTNVFKEL